MSETTKSAERLWSVRDVAAYLGVPVGTLYAWRSEGRGPASRRVGKYVRYVPADVRQWVEDLPVGIAS